MGNALVARLLYSLNQLAVEIRYRSSLSELIEDGGRIVGAVFKTGDGDIAIRANKGVVLATGGIGWSSALRDRLFPEGARRYSLVAREQHRRWHSRRRAGARRNRAGHQRARPCGCRVR